MKFRLVLITAALLFALCACTPTAVRESESAAHNKFIVGMSQCNLGEPWRVEMNRQIAEAAAQHPDLEIIFSDAAQSNEKQIADIQAFIDMGVDLIIASPNEAEPLTDIIKKAYDGGIPVILLDRKIEGDSYTQFIGADNKEIGRQAGRYVAQTMLKDGGNVIEIKGLEGTSAGIERDVGFKEGISENPDVKIVGEGNADWLRQKAVTVTAELLEQNPEVDLVFALNDPMAEGAYQAAKSAGRENEMQFIGIDGLPTPDGGLHSVKDGRLALTVIYPTGGREAVENAYKLLKEQVELEKKMTLDTTLVTPDNVQEIIEEYSAEE